jgi:hypothetical protein
MILGAELFCALNPRILLNCSPKFEDCHGKFDVQAQTLQQTFTADAGSRRRFCGMPQVSRKQNSPLSRLALLGTQREAAYACVV